MLQEGFPQNTPVQVQRMMSKGWCQLYMTYLGLYLTIKHLLTSFQRSRKSLPKEWILSYHFITGPNTKIDINPNPYQASTYLQPTVLSDWTKFRYQEDLTPVCSWQTAHICLRRIPSPYGQNFTKNQIIYQM